MPLPVVLCVDDEPNVLHGLRRSLRGAFQVYTAGSGEEALKRLETLNVAVVCSDMRMPGMDGAALLARVREVAPDTTRVLLSGQADLASLERVINGGGLFRFLVKPCERGDLVSALAEAAEHHRLKRAEKELLEGTVVGSVRLLMDALAIASPGAFGRGQRVEQLVVQMAEHEEVELNWEQRTAASLACLGLLAVPPDVLAAVEGGGQATDEDKALVADMPHAGAMLLGHIPRLHGVAGMLSAVGKPGSSGWFLETLRGAMMFVARLPYEGTPDCTLTSMRDRVPARPLETLWALHSRDRNPVIQVSTRELEEGMELAEPAMTRAGVLLMPAGLTLTPSALARLQNFGLRYGLQEPLRVRMPVLSEEDQRLGAMAS